MGKSDIKNQTANDKGSRASDIALTRELLQHAIEAERTLGTDSIILTRKVRTSHVKQAEVSSTVAAPVTPQSVNIPKVLRADNEHVASKEYASLSEHRDAICNCQKCPLGATRNKFVYGVGHPNARVLFIGEGPGADEDKIGEPFVGRAGQLLDKILQSIDLNREIAYIANVVKCRPPGNRVPSPDEMSACRPYLDEQIRLIKPDIICCLGRTASLAMLPHTKEFALGKIRQKWHEVMGIPTIVTYHPAALLRDPKYKRDCWEDMKLLRARYDALPAREHA